MKKKTGDRRSRFGQWI